MSNTRGTLQPASATRICILLAAAWIGAHLGPAQGVAAILVPSEHATIQDAIDAADRGDVVLVAPGEYVIDEPIDFNRLHDPDDPASPPVKNITLRSTEGPEVTIIRMSESPTDVDRASVVIFENKESEDSRLEGFTLTGGTGTLITGREGEGEWTLGGGALCRDGSSPVLSRCIISDNTAETGGGFCWLWGGSPTLLDSVVTDNSAVRGGGGGGLVWADASGTVRGCEIRGNTARASGGGLSSGRRSRLVVSESTIADNTAGVGAGGVFARDDSFADLTDCIVEGNAALTESGGGMRAQLRSSLRVSGGRICENTCAGSGGGVVSWNDSTTTVTDCTIRGNAAFGDTHSGGGLFCGLRSTLDVSGCTIVENTAGGHGGGIHYYNFGSGTVTDCQVRGNHSLTGGPGGFGVTRDSDVDIVDTTIEENIAGHHGGGLTYHLRCEGTVRNCVIRRNVSHGVGGGVNCSGGSIPLFTRCRIENNAAYHGETTAHGGGIRIGGSPSATVENSVIEANWSETSGGGVDTSNASPRFSNCVIACNSTEGWGGAVSARGTNTLAAHLVNCTVTHNRAADRGGVATEGTPKPRSTNSILWSNDPESAEGVLDHCLVDEDPLFRLEPECDLDAFVVNERGYLVPDFVQDPGDYYLHPSSPAIDAGVLEGAPETDIHGIPRPQGAGVDIGACELEVTGIRFLRGDTNHDGGVDLSDAVAALNFLFLGSTSPACLAAANSNGDAAVDIADPTFLLNHLFLGGPEPSAPFPACDVSTDATDLALGCDANSCE